MEFSALLWLAAKAVAIAAVPLGYVLLARDPQRFRRLAWLTAFLTLDLIMFGAFTRLTDSGLGCPDWPGCYGHSNPLSAGDQIRAAETALPTGPVTMAKAWIEMLHRYFAMAVGLLIIALALGAWKRFVRDRTRSPWLATGVLLAVCLQGAFGAWTVTLKLQPIVVTAHLLGGMALLGLLMWLALRESTVADIEPSTARWRPLALAGLLALSVQIALGGWVSANYAVLACPDFPLCQGEVIPSGMNFAQGFTLWRDLGLTADGAPVSFQALVAIHWVHRSFAYLVFAILGWLGVRLTQSPSTRSLGWGLILVLLLQLVTGLSNVVLQWPLLLAVLHNGGAAMLVAIMVAILFRLTAAKRQAAMAVMPSTIALASRA